MKKIFSLALVACMAISVSANVKVTKADLSAMQIKNDFKNSKVMLPAEKRVINNVAPAELFEKASVRNARKLATAAKADTALYVAELGLAYYGGLYDNGYSTYPMLFTPYSRDVKFYNFSVFGSEEKFGWFLGGQQVGADTNLVVPANVVFEGPAYYSEETPTFMMESGESYYYAMGNTDPEKWRYAWMAYPNFTMPLTKCQMYTSQKNKYNKTGNNFMLWTWSDTEPYYLYGSRIDFSQYGKGVGPVDTLALYWGVDGMTTSIDTIVVPVASFYSSSIAIGNKLTMTLMSKTGIVARYTATADDVKAMQVEEGDAYANLVFPIKADIKDEFMILITGFSDPSANIGFYGDGVDDTGYGETYYVNGGKVFDPFGINLCITLYAQINETGEQAVGTVNASPVKSVKEVRNGQLIIKRGDKVFNANGVEIK